MMDMEVWFGRGEYNQSVKIVSENSFVIWPLLRLVAFDSILPHFFESRYNQLLSRISPDHPSFRLKSLSKSETTDLLQMVLQEGGEGIILRKLLSPYEHGRSFYLQKMKGLLSDLDGVVSSIEHTGALILHLADGQRVKVEPANIKNNLKIRVGDIVTFSYELYTRSYITNPTVIRVRQDIVWDDVATPLSSSRKEYKTRPFRYWDEFNSRALLVQLATKHNLNPSISETWYHLSSSHVLEVPGGETVLRKYGGYVQLIQAIFPNLKVEPIKFRGRAMWKENKDNHRTFFENYAKQNKFDFRVPENWYSLLYISRHIKGSYGLLKYYNYDLSQALVQIFPDVNFDKTKFILGRHFAKDTELQRKYCEQFAHRQGFDPLVPDKWYSIPANLFWAQKGSKTILRYYNFKFSTMLVSIFPEIGLKENLFSPHLQSRNIKKII